jgi:hypothetical protein
VQLSLTIAISENETSVKNGLILCLEDRIFFAKIEFNYLISECCDLPKIVLPIEKRLDRGLIDEKFSEKQLSFMREE